MPAASFAFGGVMLHLCELYSRKRVIDVCDVFFVELATIHEGDMGWRRVPDDCGRVPPRPELRPGQSTYGAIISAKEFRARFSLDLTVPRLHSVISAISSYDLPSSSRRMNTLR